ncbi:hypothetical protein AX774_g3354 [Zancudomyces culisetae]|uniref:Uncharacterized protein n=1 Tax=Zancudomyces culisetae TaxID=1213189 RepID=A0A1R1PQC6_ZANCU|nr:hypothetical protein AX774_g5558 [Zancudomyces culisetae]OMH83158.1 hypothetical protein AX774_g3354 [Zancudomyces culisetae]|eukprot:OMH80998.1 hypothetical protein AX774_g5558 [Zancudomyces culisetae]
MCGSLVPLEKGPRNACKSGAQKTLISRNPKTIGMSCEPTDERNNARLPAPPELGLSNLLRQMLPPSMLATTVVSPPIPHVGFVFVLAVHPPPVGHFMTTLSPLDQPARPRIAI